MSFSILAMVVLGGMGNIWGVALGAFVIYTIQIVSASSSSTPSSTSSHVPILKDINFVQYQFLLYGLALVLMMLFRPEGLFPSETPEAGAPCRRGPRRRRRWQSDRAARREHRPMTAGDDARAGILLQAEHITKRFGGLVAVNDVELRHPARARSSA